MVYQAGHKNGPFYCSGSHLVSKSSCVNPPEVGAGGADLSTYQFHFLRMLSISKTYTAPALHLATRYFYTYLYYIPAHFTHKKISQSHLIGQMQDKAPEP